MLSRQIFLIGMPGCGKSTLGRRAAREAGVTFLDLDRWIEECAGMTVSEIFEKYQEDGFRRMETNGMAFLAGSAPALIAVGGGTPMNPENRKIMLNCGSVILIDRPVEKILSDLRPENRPLMREDPEGKLRELYDVRMPVFRQVADVTLRNDGEFSATSSLLVRVLKERYHA